VATGPRRRRWQCSAKAASPRAALPPRLRDHARQVLDGLPDGDPNCKIDA
jgi:hypothetical protein